MALSDFRDRLQNKVIDLEVANHTPSPTVDPSVHVVLCGHSMGGIVAAETLLSIARDEPVPSSQPDENIINNQNNTTSTDNLSSTTRTNLDAAPPDERPRSTTPTSPPSLLFFPYIKAVLAFDTPFLGISPGVLAHGAEEQYNQASTAYKAFDTASQFFNKKTQQSASTQPIANASSRGLPATEGAAGGGGGWGKWGKYAMFGGVAAAAVAGAAYMNRDQITQGLSWAGSHLEFVGCLGRAAELKKRVQKTVELTKTHNVGFANFYGVLGNKDANRTKYADALSSEDRTFCLVPNDARNVETSTGMKRSSSPTDQNPSKRRKSAEGEVKEEPNQAQDFASDPTKSKGRWVKCINPTATNEIRAHMSMFDSNENPDYHAMIPRARDQIVEWIDQAWYKSSDSEQQQQQQQQQHHEMDENTTVENATVDS